MRDAGNLFLAFFYTFLVLGILEALVFGGKHLAMISRKKLGLPEKAPAKESKKPQASSQGEGITLLFGGIFMIFAVFVIGGLSLLVIKLAWIGWRTLF